jgi:hypothetical protein
VLNALRDATAEEADIDASLPPIQEQSEHLKSRYGAALMPPCTAPLNLTQKSHSLSERTSHGR